MLQSSLGFHTVTLSLHLTLSEACHLIRDFKRFNDATGCIQMYRKNEKKESIKYYPKDSSSSTFPLHTNIKIYFTGEYKGIKWTIRNCNFSGGYSDYVVEATINPKFLAGITDYLTAATYGDMNIAITNFNDESKKISRLLGSFPDYRITRIDYCVNLRLDELAYDCSPELAIKLIKRGNIPPSYEEWTIYDDISHRKKSRPGSFYLCNNSVTINCYSKYMQLLERSYQNIEKGHPPISTWTLEQARNIIRFEVQCKYPKTYSLFRAAEYSGGMQYNKYKELFSPDCCIKIVSDYYKKVIGNGDWYALSEAVRIIKSHQFNRQREERLIQGLQAVGNCRSIAKAKSTYDGNESEAFKRTLKELSDLNINPVTIPREWGVKHIPNLLCTYFTKLCEEHYSDASSTCIAGNEVAQAYADYVRLYGHAPI